MMKQIALCIALAVTTVPAWAAKDCKQETGKAVWSLIAAENEPIGRILGPTTGTLKAATSAYLTSLFPSGGALQGTSVETWVFGPKDSLVFSGAETFTPVNASGDVNDDLTLTVVSGTGEFAGATGSLHVTGTGFNLLSPTSGPGNTYFEVTYQGIICRVRP
jgi:hypothetical protein